MAERDFNHSVWNISSDPCQDLSNTEKKRGSRKIGYPLIHWLLIILPTQPYANDHKLRAPKEKPSSKAEPMTPSYDFIRIGCSSLVMCSDTESLQYVKNWLFSTCQKPKWLRIRSWRSLPITATCGPKTCLPILLIWRTCCIPPRWNGGTDYSEKMTASLIYPLVNCYIAMERSTIFNGKIHYFYGHVQ